MLAVLGLGGAGRLVAGPQCATQNGDTNGDGGRDLFDGDLQPGLFLPGWRHAAFIMLLHSKIMTSIYRQLLWRARKNVAGG